MSSRESLISSSGNSHPFGGGSTGPLFAQPGRCRDYRAGCRGWRPADGRSHEDRDWPKADGRTHPPSGGGRGEAHRALDRRQPARRLELGQGVLGLAWIQGKPGDPVRPDDKVWTAREHAWDLYFTASSDGGTTLAAPVPLLETSARTDPKLTRWPHGTDYISLSASPEGAFHPLWVDTRDSMGQIQTARIEVRA